MMRKFPKILVIPLVLLVACLAVYILEGQTKFLRKAVDSYLYDNVNHYLPCEKLPTLDFVEQVVAQHAEVVKQIEGVHPGNVGVEIEESSCPGRADLLIWYASHQDRLAIEKIIGAETFFGVPYRLQNV